MKIEKPCERWFPKHDWSRWGIVGFDKKELIRLKDLKKINGIEVSQMRECELCGLREFINSKLYD